MKVKTIFTICTICAAFFLYASFFPVGTRSAQSDVKGGDKHVIALRRPHYLIPREYHSHNEMNPINFWSYAADPVFDVGKISSHRFKDMDGKIKTAAVQGFQINYNYDNPAYSEDVVAVRIDGQIYDYPTPGFMYSSIGKNSVLHYIGRESLDLYYYYPFAGSDRDDKFEYGHNEAVIKITLPHGSGTAEIVKSYDPDKWAALVAHLRQIDLSPDGFETLCKPEPKWSGSREFAENVFAKPCP
ncbi:MAG: hypothetical protein CSA68_10285 [Rhodobacterales bacterium]|nr:MAG: hypothetical protein CSA68_10285 [Rhodobacterales bacterium]